MRFRKKIKRIAAFVLCVVVCMTSSPIWLQQSDAAALPEKTSQQSEDSRLAETEIRGTQKKENAQVSESQNQTDTEEQLQDTKSETEKQSDSEEQSEKEKKEDSEKQTNTQKKESEKEKEGEEKDSSENAKDSLDKKQVTPKLSSIDFTVDAIVAAGIEDRNFAQAIYDAIVQEPTKFLNGNTLDTNSFSTIEELLNAFTGDVIWDGVDKTEDKKIKSVVGLQLLRVVGNIDLKNNLIQNLMPISVTKAEKDPDVTLEEQHYYGTYGLDVHMDFRGNPVDHFPVFIGGRVTAERMTSNSIKLKQQNLVFLSDGTANFIGNSAVKLEIYANEKHVDLLKTATQIRENVICGVKIADGAETGGRIESLPVENILLTGSFDVVLGTLEKMFWFGADTDYDSMTPDGTSFKYNIPVLTKIYNKTELDEQTTSHSVSLEKLGADDNKGKAGAVYNLYTKADVLVKANLTTTANGFLNVEGLAAGEYYFKETKAPEGYDINQDKISFVLEDGKISINGGAGSQLETAEGKTETVKDGVFMLSGDTSDPVKLEVKAPTNGKLKSITVEWTEGKNRSAGEQTFEVTDTEDADAIIAKAEAKINDARQLYQNVKISSSFTQMVSVKQLDTLTPVEVELKAEKKLIMPNGDETTVPEGEFNFSLKNADTGAVVEEKANGADGTVKFNAISINKEGTYNYIIVEIDDKKPGYKYDENKFKVKAVIQKETGTDKLKITSVTYESVDENVEVTDMVFKNKLLAVPFSFVKVDGKDYTTPLKDVKFVLYTCSKNHTDAQHNELATNDTDNCWKERETVTSDENGVVNFTDLPGGEYQLVEIQTNPGYALPLGQWRISVDAANAQKPIEITAVGASQPPAFKVEGEGANASYKLPNFKKTDLPLTGGTGTIIFTATGIILMLGAIMLFVKLYRKQK